ncbi:hypothetical protein HanRHA438_CPg0863471 (chloroplast) [Helianthus annuus]|nr:hypothetical protein HanRHA438_CPg0863471 [Helianthus annuus]KAJ0959139.1 hypothetical protein HanPSC8_Chr00c451g0808551 [Helianthus annuus]
MYPTILNCGYRNDKIVFDCIEYEPPIEDRQEIKDKEEKTLFRDRNRHLSKEFKGSGINEGKRGTRSQ